MRTTPKGVEDLVRQTAVADAARYGTVDIAMEEEPGASGKIVIDHYQRQVLFGYPFRGIRSTGPKEEIAKPLSAASEAGNFKLVAGAWNHDWLNQAEAFPPIAADVHDDMVDATAKGYARLTGQAEWQVY